MQVLPRQIRPDEVEQEVTQRDQFNTDAVGLAETLVREALQNSMDVPSRFHLGPVTARISITEPSEAADDFWREVLTPLQEHLNASGVDLAGLQLQRPRLLVVEDFGTTGLVGAIDRKDDGNFSDFWRRTGRSHKSGEKGGRWGLGKLVFTSASRIHTFFGLTVRDDDSSCTGALMGQAVLRHHSLGGLPSRDFAPHVAFGVRGPDSTPLPVTTAAEVARFVVASDVRRVNEPGLSIVVPHLHPEITLESVLPHVVRNWFFPILTGKLIVQVGEKTIDPDSFSELAREHGGAAMADGHLVSFIGSLHTASTAAPSVTLGHAWRVDGVENALDKEQLKTLRSAYSEGELVGVRAPLEIRPKIGPAAATFVDLYLRRAPGLTRGEALFVRGSITIPGEAKRFRGRECYGALVAGDGTVASFLGDAEGPAHTTWSGTAEKVRERWKNSPERLREIRDALNSFYTAVATPDDRRDPDALKDVFNVKKSGAVTTRHEKRIVIPPVVPTIKRRPPTFRIQQRSGGFSLRGTLGTTMPMELRVRVAYDVAEGNPLAAYRELDFKFGDGEIELTTEGAAAQPTSANELIVQVLNTKFDVSVSGFDEKRDLFVKVDRVTS